MERNVGMDVRLLMYLHVDLGSPKRLAVYICGKEINNDTRFGERAKVNLDTDRKKMLALSHQAWRPFTYGFEVFRPRPR